MAFLPAAVAVVAILANTQGQEMWAAVLVLIVAVWALDIGTAFAARGREFASLAVVVTAAGSAMAAHVAGGGRVCPCALVIAAVVSLGWAVAFPNYRQVDVFSPTRDGLSPRRIGHCVSRRSPGPLTRLRRMRSMSSSFPSSPPSGLSAIVERINPIPLLDPFSVTALGAVLAAVAAALIWDLSVVSYLLVGLGIAVALLAGEVCRRCCEWAGSS